MDRKKIFDTADFLEAWLEGIHCCVEGGLNAENVYHCLYAIPMNLRQALEEEGTINITGSLSDNPISVEVKPLASFENETKATKKSSYIRNKSY